VTAARLFPLSGSTHSRYTCIEPN